jgi:hypothetical protein
VFGGLFFLVLNPHVLGCHNFFNYILFLMIFSALDAPLRGVQVFF